MTVLELARWKAALDTGPMEWYWPEWHPFQCSADNGTEG